jgi:hypothetical protein
LDGRNWYAYVENNPNRYADPTGLQAVDSVNASIKSAIVRGVTDPINSINFLSQLLATGVLSSGTQQRIQEAIRAIHHNSLLR